MKFIVIGDPHIRGTAPSSRNDDFSSNLIIKFIGIEKLIKKHKADGVIIPGDMYDYPRVDVTLAGRINNIIRSWNVPVYVIPGNHDLYGNNPKTLSKTMLGYAIQSGVVKLVTRDKFISLEDPDGTKIHIEGQSYHELIDNPSGDINKDFGIKNCDDPDTIKVLLIHAYLLDKERFPFLSRFKSQDPDPEKQRPYCTLFKDIPKEADLIIAGHYHENLGVVKNKGQVLLNPGNITRLSITKRDVYYGLVEIKNNQVTAKSLKFPYAKPADEIFDHTQHTLNKSSKQLLDDYKALLKSSNFKSSMSIHDILDEVIKEQNIDAIVSKKAKQILIDAEVDFEDNSSLNSKGFVAHSNRVYIKSAYIENYMSHAKTKVDFVDGLNVITGPSNSGKTTVFRAIEWCLFNKPNGSDFIRTGKKNVKVIVELSNGYTVERCRTKKATGHYKVTDSKGKETIFEKFKEVPMEVYNASQMPIVKLSDNYSTCLNIGSQFEGPFLLSATSSDRASAVGRLINIEPLDDAIYKLNSKNLSMQKSIKVFKTDIEKNESILNIKYSDMDKRKKRLSYVKLNLDAMKNKEEKLTKIEEKIKEFGAVTDNLSKSHSVLSGLGDLALADSLLTSMQYANRKHTSISNTSKIYATKIKELDSLETVLESVKDIDSHINTLESIGDVMKRFNKLRKLTESYDRLEVCIKDCQDNLTTIPDVNIDGELYRLNSIHDKGQRLKKLYKQHKDISQKISKEEAKIDKIENQYLESKKQLEKLLEENGTCPLCNQKITVENILGSDKDG